MAAERRDIVVVGRDLASVIFAELAAEKGRQVEVLHWQDDRTSLGFIESGLLAGRTWNRRAFCDGTDMLTGHFAYAWRERPTVLALPLASPVTPFATQARSFTGLRRLEEADVAPWHPFLAPGYAYYSAPDVSFPLDELLALAERRAGKRGVRFREAPVAVDIDPSTRNGYAITSGDMRIEPTAAFVALGVHSVPFAEQLSLPHSLIVQRSSVLEVDTSLGCPEGAFVDGPTGVAITSFSDGRRPHRGRLVIRVEVSNPAASDEGTPDQQELILRRFPALVPRENVTWVSGTVVGGSFTNQPISNLVPYTPQPFPGLMFATTQQPMLALRHAQHTLSLLLTNTPPRKKRAA